jgi:hypothetical protein
MRILFIFLDGVGLGPDDPFTNPFARAELPNLGKLLAVNHLLADSAPLEAPHATLKAIDPNLGVDGLPQSATGQAVLLTGLNVPAKIGYHYGPKPNPETAAFLQDGGIFGRLARAGKTADLVNAYPPGYFHGVESGKRLYSAIPLAVTKAGLSLHTLEDLQANRAISADFTAEGWRERMNLPDIPTFSPPEAGSHLARLAQRLDFAFFEYWLSDYAGHEQDMTAAVSLLEKLDAVFGGLFSAWDLEQDLILVTSDHGNLEDLSTRRHTANPVPLLLAGPEQARRAFDSVTDLSGVAPTILSLLGVGESGKS